MSDITGHIRDIANDRCCRCGIDLNMPHHDACRVDLTPGAGDLHGLARDAAIQALLHAPELKLSDVAPVGSSVLDRSPDGLRADLVAAVSGEALRAVVIARVGQIVKHGHDAEADAMMPILWLPKRVKDFAELAYAAIGLTGTDRNPDAAEKRLAQCAALCLAAIDRIRLARLRREG